MTSWKLIILALKQHGLREVTIAQQVGCGQSTINDLLHERLVEPRYPVGVALHALMDRQGKAGFIDTTPKRSTSRAKRGAVTHIAILPDQAKKISQLHTL